MVIEKGFAPAEAAFREAARIRPDYADARGNLAHLLAGKGDFDEAREQFETALRLRPGDAAARYNLALLLGRTKQYEEALRAQPESGRAHLGLGAALAAAALRQIKAGR